jgi:hypothetical protein
MHKSGHQLYWLPSHSLSVSQLVQEGFNWLDCAAGWGEPNSNWDGWERTKFQKYCELLPVSADQWLAKVSPKFFPTPMYQDGWGHSAPASFFTHIGQLIFDKVALVNWYRKVFLEFDISISAEFEKALYEPHLLVRLGYHLAKKVARAQCIESTAFQAAMSAVGTGCIGSDLSICKHCFRRSRGELGICDLHSQAKIVLDLAGRERITQINQVRATRKAARAIDPKTIPKRQFNGYWELDLYEFERQVGAILWPLVGAAHDEWLSQIMHCLTFAPLVKKKLSESFIGLPYHSQIEQLQQAVGSREWLVSRWPILIPLAETWLLAEKNASPGPIPPGLTEKNLQRVETAHRLLAKNVTYGQIAEDIGITRAHLRQLLHRERANR